MNRQLFMHKMREFFRIHAVPTIPSSFRQADLQSLFGIVGFLANLSTIQKKLTPLTTSGTNITLTAAQALSGMVTLATGASNDYTITLPSTAALIGALGNTVPLDGSFYMPISFVDGGTSHTGTLTHGDTSTTMSGTMTIATATRRDFILNVTGKTTITITNVGSATL